MDNKHIKRIKYFENNYFKTTWKASIGGHLEDILEQIRSSSTLIEKNPNHTKIN